MSRKRLAKAKPKRARAKKVLRKGLQPTRAQRIPVRETLIVDVVEEPVPGVITVTEFEETDVREAIVNPEQPEED